MRPEWLASLWNNLFNSVLPQRDEPDAKIISVTAMLDAPNNSAIIDALIERWGTAFGAGSSFGGGQI